MKWIGDFETTSAKREKHDGKTFVWACGLCEVGNPDNVIILRTIEEFIEFFENQPENDYVWFHNLRFDGNFIVQHLLRTGWTCAKEPKEKKSKSFSVIISDDGLWYQIDIYYFIRGNKVNKVTVRDSLKLIPLSVRQIAKSFDLPIKKGKIDYAAHDFLPYGSPITEEEKDYLIHDVQIVEHALRFFHDQGLDKMTIGSCALDEFKKLINRKWFKMFFPPAGYYRDVKPAYKGGFTYLNPKFKGKIVKNIFVFDVNSLYPSVMAGVHGELLPYGTPIMYEGEYKEDEFYPLYIQKIKCSFELKEGKIPCIQIKHGGYGFKENLYLTSSDHQEVDLTLTSVDLKLFFDNYHVYNPQYIRGWKFKAAHGSVIFGEYVEKWSKIKIQSKEEGNLGMYLIAKLFLNNLYGKFGTEIEVVSKYPVLGEDGKIHFKKKDPEIKEGVYIAMACFITAWARDMTIRSAQKIQDDYYAGISKNQFIYADTDSLHVYTPDNEIPKGLNIHPTDLGAWDHEATASIGKFLRQKCYIEKHIITEKEYEKALSDDETIKSLYTKEKDQYYKLKITVAGMPESCHDQVTFQNFRIGATYSGKLKHTTVRGGVVLEEIDFNIKA